MFPMQGNQPDDKLYVDDVFSAYTYTGNGSTQTINNGIDLAGEGGLVWIKSRSSAEYHYLADTARGRGYGLSSNNTGAQQAIIAGRDISSFNSSGFSLGQDYGYSSNTNTFTFVSWAFRKADRFFSHSSVVKSSGSNATVSFPGLETLGMVAVKRTDSTGSWYVWHRSLTAGKLLYLEQTAAEATLGHITVSGTTVTLVNGVIADGTYIVYAWAHDTASDGIVQCGSFTTDGSGNATVTLGWEPQFAIVKASSTTSNWGVSDIMMGATAGGTVTRGVYANLSNAEGTIAPTFYPTATGFGGIGNATQTYIYLAIRRPNKPPTVGTQVYNAIARTGTGAAATVTGVGFAPDLHAVHSRSGTTGGRWEDRLRGATREIVTETTAAEAAVAQSVISFNMDGASIGTDGDWNTNTATYINHFFKRAPGVFDVVCYTSTTEAASVTHGLTVAPEFVLIKSRSAAESWYAHHVASASYSPLSTAMFSTGMEAYAPTATVFKDINAVASRTRVAYLFATLAGISKVGSYTGNGSSQTINCGFTTGARFFLVKATSTTGSWWIFDSTRGVVSSFDPALQLNSTAAEITSADAVDPDASGIIVNQEATCSINASGVSYVYLAIS